VKTTSLKLPPDLDRQVAARSRSQGVSRGAVVREALTEYFGNRRRASVSFADRARDLIGSVTGPPDLSTNADYLDDLGR